jgi:hypothetical protein
VLESTVLGYRRTEQKLDHGFDFKVKTLDFNKLFIMYNLINKKLSLDA